MRTLLRTLTLAAIFGLAALAIAALQSLGSAWRTDLTEDQLYTLSSGTVRTLAALDSPVHLELYFTERATRDIPQLRNYKRRVSELLAEYVLRSDGKVTLSQIDPKPFSEAEDRAASIGLTPATFTPGTPAVYFGLAATGERDEAELIPFFHPADDATLEQSISKAVLLAGRAQAPKVAIISNLDIDGGFDQLSGRPTAPWMAIQQLRDLMDVRLLASDVSTIPDDVSALVVIHPNALPDTTLYAIDQFVLSGGNLALFIDPLAESLSLGGAPAEAGTGASNPVSLLAAWGVEMVDSKAILDARHAIAVPTRVGNQSVRHLGLYRLPAPTEERPIVGGLEVFNFASAGSLRQRENAATQFTPLLSSSPESALIDAQELEFLFNPATLYDGFTPTGDTYTVAALLRGRPQTAFPEGAPDASNTDTHRSEAERDAAIVVVTDTDFLFDQMWVQVEDFFGQRVARAFADNGSFFLNTVETLLGEADLISLRARGQHHRPFHVVEALEQEADARFRAKERELTARLTETETRLANLQRAKDGNDVLVLSNEQQQAISEFEAEKLAIRKQLRAVQLQLREDIDALENRLKLINIVIAPLLLTLLLYVIVLLHRLVTRRPF